MLAELVPPVFETLTQMLECRSQDGSLRVRRAAMRVLSGAAVRADSPVEGRVLHTVALKCRDRSASLFVCHACTQGRVCLFYMPPLQRSTMALHPADSCMESVSCLQVRSSTMSVHATGLAYFTCIHMDLRDSSSV